jgi:vitamin B12 transporter
MEKMSQRCRARGLFAVAPLTLVVMLTSATSARADSLGGKVVDAQGLVVPNAAIVLHDRNSGDQRNTVSARDGSYRFGEIPAGAYLIEADAAASALVVSKEVSVKGDVMLDLMLEVAGTRTGVVVTASSTPQTIIEVAKAVDTVTAEQIELRDVFQITEALRVLPGLQVQTLEGPGSLTTIKTRGLRASDTAVLIDGMRFQDAASLQNDATSFLEDLTITDTERIEFMRGSGSSLYGSNAMAGVINIVSRSGGGPVSGELRAEGGGLGLFRGVAGIGGGSDHVNYSGSVSHVNIADGVRGRSPYQNTSAQGSVRYSVTPGAVVTGRIWGTSAKLTGSVNPTLTPAVLANSSSTGEVPAIPLPMDQLALYEQGLPFTAGNATYIPSQIDPDANRLSSFVSGTAAYQQVVSANATYRIAYQGVDTRRGYRDGPEGSGPFQPFSVGTGHFNGRTDTVQARLDQHLGSHSFLTAGYEFGRERYVAFDDTPADPTETNGIRLSQLSHSFYAQDQIPLAGGRLQVALSGRAQLFTLRQPIFSDTTSNPYAGTIGNVETPNAYTGDASVAYFNSTSQTKLRAHGGNSYRAPGTYERFGGGFGSFYGDPRLKPERAVAIDGGIDQWLVQQKLQVSGTIFWTKLQETILFANSLPPGDAFGRFFGYENGGGGRARGVELSAQVSTNRRTTAFLSYTYTDSISTTPTVGTDYFKTLNLAPHTFALSVTQWFMPRLHVTFDLFTKSHYVLQIANFDVGSRLFDFNGGTKANLVVGYEIPTAGAKRIELYTKIENVFDRLAYEDGFVGPGRWAVAGVRLKY